MDRINARRVPGLTISRFRQEGNVILTEKGNKKKDDIICLYVAHKQISFACFKEFVGWLLNTPQ